MDEKEWSANRILIMASAIISIISIGVVMAVHYHTDPKKRNYAQKLLLYLCLAELVESLTFLISLIVFFINYPGMKNGEQNFFCSVQGFFKLFSNLASYAWVGVIEWAVWKVFIKREQIDIKSPFKKNLLLCSLLPIFLAFM